MESCRKKERYGVYTTKVLEERVRSYFCGGNGDSINAAQPLPLSNFRHGVLTFFGAVCVCVCGLVLLVAVCWQSRALYDARLSRDFASLLLLFEALKGSCRLPLLLEFTCGRVRDKFSPHNY